MDSPDLARNSYLGKGLCGYDLASGSVVARYYDAEIGRFISPDTVVPDWTDPQSFNRYSYCRNNPLRYIDPSGHLFGITQEDIDEFAEENWDNPDAPLTDEGRERGRALAEASVAAHYDSGDFTAGQWLVLSQARVGDVVTVTVNHDWLTQLNLEGTHTYEVAEMPYIHKERPWFGPDCAQRKALDSPMVTLLVERGAPGWIRTWDKDPPRLSIPVDEVMKEFKSGTTYALVRPGGVRAGYGDQTFEVVVAYTDALDPREVTSDYSQWLIDNMPSVGTGPPGGIDIFTALFGDPLKECWDNMFND